MSKRVSNKKGPARKTPARSTVRWGWRRKRAAHLAMLKKHAEGLALSTGQLCEVQSDVKSNAVS